MKHVSFCIIALSLFVYAFASSSGCSAATAPQPAPSPTVTVPSPVPLPPQVPANVNLTVIWTPSVSASPSPVPSGVPVNEVTGYRVYRSTTEGSYVYGPTSPNLVCSVASSTDTCTMVTPSLVTYYFVVTAIDGLYSPALESAPSNEISFEYPNSCPNSSCMTDHFKATPIFP